ncbi:hypothetical protein ABZ484_32390 [Streptomyces sp. NPDC006393]|uniref:hypothetical protein n=1 Tax=Streptomyces sp. NPDC006393 TaxID=3156763 RepID=UPI0033E4DE45
MTGNIRTFTESSLPDDQYTRAIEYVCYERNFFYIYSTFHAFESFPLVHLDRFIGWRHDLGVEPLLPVSNGFADLLDAHVRDSSSTTPENLWDSLHDLFGQGHKVSVNMWVTHTDGTPYVTSVLLEGMDEAKTVYFTKVNETLNRTCSPLSFADFTEKIAPDDDGTIGLTVIKDSDVIRDLAGRAPLDAFRHLFHDLYGYGFQDGRLVKDGRPVALDLSGFDELIAHLEQAEPEVIVDGAVPKQQQFRLNKHIHNRFVPIQYYLRYVLDTPELAALVSPDLAERVREQTAEMERALGTVLKFASLLVQRPQSAIYGMYVDAIRHLRAVQPAYQQVNLDVLHSLARTGTQEA